MIIYLTWIITAISLIGTILNIKKNIACFYLWTIGNIAWLIFDLYSGLYSRTVLDMVQLVFSIWGIIAWNNKK